MLFFCTIIEASPQALAAKAEAEEKEKDELSNKLPGLKDQLVRVRPVVFLGGVGRCWVEPKCDGSQGLFQLQNRKSEIRGGLGLKDGTASDDPELAKIRVRAGREE